MNTRETYLSAALLIVVLALLAWGTSAGGATVRAALDMPASAAATTGSVYYGTAADTYTARVQQARTGAELRLEVLLTNLVETTRYYARASASGVLAGTPFETDLSREISFVPSELAEIPEPPVWVQLWQLLRRWYMRLTGGRWERAEEDQWTDLPIE